MPQWLFPLLTLLWNHHTFQRGKRAGKSPLELAGVDAVPALSDVLSQVLASIDKTERDASEQVVPSAGLDFLFNLESVPVAA